METRNTMEIESARYLEELIINLYQSFPFIERKIKRREDQKLIATHIFSLKEEKEETQRGLESYQRMILIIELGKLLGTILQEVGNVQDLAESKSYSKALLFYREVNWEFGNGELRISPNPEGELMRNGKLKMEDEIQ